MTVQTISAQSLLDDIVESRGGIAKFDGVQVQIARTVVRLMCGLERTAASDTVQAAATTVRTAATMATLMAQLPPVVDASHRQSNRISKNMTLHEAAAAYQRMIHDIGRVNEYEPWTTDDLKSDGSPIIDGTINEPPTPARTAAADAPADPPGAPAPPQLSEPGPISAGADELEAPADYPVSPVDRGESDPPPWTPDPRLAHFGGITYCWAG